MMIQRLTLLMALLCSMRVMSQHAMQFDGLDDYAQAVMPGPLDSASRTVEAWVNITTATLSKPQVVVVDWGDMATGHRFTFNIRNGIPRIEVGGNGISAPSAISANAWHHLAASFAKAGNPQVRLYVDGMEVINGNFTIPVVTSSVNGIIIGRRNDGINNFEGMIDEVRVWNVDRTASEILNNMNKEFCSPQANLVAYYNFNQGIAGGNNPAITYLQDNSGSLNHAFLNNLSLASTTSNFVNGMNLSTVNTNITLNAGVLSSDALTGNYQWLDCSNGFAPIAGETQINYIPTSLGNYSVMVTENWCSDTSACINLATVFVDENRDENPDFTIYPNPLLGEENLQITFKQAGNHMVRIVDMRSQLITNIQTIADLNSSIDIHNLASGVYLIELIENGFVTQKKLLK